MLKIYTLLHDFSLCTPIDVDGRVVSVTFGGGCKALRQNGEYSTTDADVQYALEHASGYNVTYKLRKTFLTADDERPVAGRAGFPVNPVENGGEIAGVVADGGSFLVADESWMLPKVCVTLNEATEWLVSLGYKKTNVSTSAKAIAAAAEQGYELRFEKTARG